MSDGTSDPTIGRLVDGRYRVLHHLADGGMGSVYVAVDERLDRQVALKLMRPDLARDPAFVDRFRREARSAARLSHPHVVGVYDQGQDGELVFLVMEYVDGRTLRDVLDLGGALSPREALRVMRQILQALAEAHRAGLVHRDVKPENVLITPEGQVKVADFGLARAVTAVTTTTQGATVLGTVSYLAPEQVESGAADARSDVYAAGLVLYEMLTGARAVQGDTPIQVAYRHVHGQIAPPSEHRPGLAPSLDHLVAHATRRDPQERPADAAELLRSLMAVEASLTAEQADLGGHTGAAATVSSARGALHTDRITRPTQPVPRWPPPAVSAGGTGVLAPAGRGAGAASAGDAMPRDGRADARATSAGRGAGAGTADVLAPHPPSGQPGPADTRPGRGEAPRGVPGGPSGARRRRSSLATRVLAALIAVALLTGGSVGWYMFAGPGAQRTVPTVRTLSEQDAVAALAAADLQADVVPTFSETVVAGRVISVDPAEGSSVRRSTAVGLAVSKGPERYVVPDVVGRPLGDARTDITDTHLVVRTVKEDFSETVSAGQVISVDPAVGSRQKRDTPVDIVVSKGREPLKVQDWTGKPYAEAAAALQKQGLVAQILSEDFSTDVPKGSIIKQTPASGTAYKGTQITFTVSKGPDLVTVPGVTGKSEQEAVDLLRAAGFQVEVSRIAGGLFGTAHSTDPAANTKAPRGSRVTLRVV